MNQMACIYPDRESVIVAYLYDDIDTAERVAFETHVNTCLVCRSELAAFRAVRSPLAKWAPPLPERAFSLAGELRAPSPEPRAWWQQVPIWAQVAAAILVLGVSASIANLTIRYDRTAGCTITTGWPKTVPAAAPSAENAAPWRAELAALQNDLRAEMRAQASTVRATAASSSSSGDAEVLRRVRAMLDESQKNQEKELALRLAQQQIDVNAQLDADRRRQNENFRTVTSTYTNQMLRQQQQINYALSLK